MSKNIYRQGDVLIVPVDSIPATVSRVDDEGGRLILARGEATGHHHSFPHNRSAVMFRDDVGGGGVLLSVGDVAAPLEHQEHSTLDIAPGNYKVSIQRTYAAGMARRVAD